MSRYKDIIFLLGAGASVGAGIPASGMMIDEIEKLMNTDGEWKDFLSLYNHIKSAIRYSAGLQGKFDSAVSYNIETLVNTLYELERNEEHPLYPFIASWNSRLVALAGGDFSSVKEFRRLILRKLKNWMSPDDVSRADYYQGIVQLQHDLTFPLRIFSLNYDLCVERLSSSDFRVETGFPRVGPTFTWDWERFEESDSGPPPPQLYLYKLHSSINWKRDESKNVYCVEQTEGIAPESMQLIFGREFKLEAADPYLFYAYEFRRFSLLAKLIVAVGYGFADDHVNKILSLSLTKNPATRLLAICNCNDAHSADAKAKEIAKCLSVSESQIVVGQGTSKDLFETPELSKQLVAHIAKPEGSPF